MNLLSRSFWSSVIATSFMTTAFFRLHRSLPVKDRKPLPPAQLTESMRRKFPLKKPNSEIQQNATLIAHYGYGFGCAGIYSSVAPHLPMSGLKKGMLFGAGVWAASYFGLIPAIDGRPQGIRMSSERNAMMFAAHLVWGAALGYADERLLESGKTMLDGRSDITS